MPPLPPLAPSQATQALSVALNKVGELRHLQGDLAAAAEQYAAALRLRRALLAARQRQWAGEGSGEPREGGSGAAAAAAGEEAGAGSEACCSAALDLAASCLKLSGARAGLGESGEAEVRQVVEGGVERELLLQWSRCSSACCTPWSAPSPQLGLTSHRADVGAVLPNP